MSCGRETLEKLAGTVRVAVEAMSQLCEELTEVASSPAKMPSKSATPRVPYVACEGCRNMRCTADWRDIDSAPSSDDQIVAFLQSHGFFKKWACPEHGLEHGLLCMFTTAFDDSTARPEGRY